MKIRSALCFFLVILLSGAYAEPKLEPKQHHSEKITLSYFWSRYCPHCKEAKPFVNNLPKLYPWLSVRSYDLVDNKVNQQLYRKMAAELNQPANSVPAFIFCDQMIVGYDRAETTGETLKQKLAACYQKKNFAQDQPAERISLPWFGELHYQAFSLPVFTLIIAALDAFNPCAFFILLFLLSLITHLHSRLKILTIGCIFVLSSGVMYFLFMTAWLNFFLLTDHLKLITTIAGFIAVCFGLINIKDYFIYKQGITLSMSGSTQSKLMTRMRKLIQTSHWPAMISATVVLAIAANSYELVCTAGLPMIYTRILTIHNLSDSQYYLYLILYNLIYILPLLVIVLIFCSTLGNKKLSEHEGRILKLLSGSMMTGLGIILLVTPDWLNNMLVSIAVLAGAILFTIMVVIMHKLVHRETD